MTVKGELHQLIESFCIQEGSFVLSSGQKSNWYIDLKPLLLNRRGGLLSGEVMTEEIDLLKGPIEYVGGPSYGGALLATSTSLVSNFYGKPIDAFYVREEQKNHGTESKIVAGFSSGHSSVLDHFSKVVVVDDVTTTGNSLVRCVYELMQLGITVVAVISLVDRMFGAESKIHEISKDSIYKPVFYFKKGQLVKV